MKLKLEAQNAHFPANSSHFMQQFLELKHAYHLSDDNTYE